MYISYNAGVWDLLPCLVGVLQKTIHHKWVCVRAFLWVALEVKIIKKW